MSQGDPRPDKWFKATLTRHGKLFGVIEVIAKDLPQAKFLIEDLGDETGMATGPIEPCTKADEVKP